MYVTMEAVRFVYARYVENDLEMYDEPTDSPAQARNSNIIEDLGQIQYIFSDKTGTLTQNDMIFAKCSISGLKYGECVQQETIAAASREHHPPAPLEKCDSSSTDSSSTDTLSPGTRFADPRLLSRLQAQHATANEIHEFLLLLALCNTVIPSIDPESKKIRYQASSPDEESLVFAAYALGYQLQQRDGQICTVNILGKEEKWKF